MQQAGRSTTTSRLPSFAAAPHLIIAFAVSEDAVREVDTMPRFESLSLVAPRFTPPPRPVVVTVQRPAAPPPRLRSH